MPTGGCRIARHVRATNVSDPSLVFEFPSIYAVSKQTEEWLGQAVHHEVIKRWVNDSKEMHGYKWESILPEVSTTEIDDVSNKIDGYLKCINCPIEEIPEWMQKNRIHVRCILEHDVYWVSAFDIMTSTFGLKNSRVTYDRVRCLYAELFTRNVQPKQFPGKGMKLTPCIQINFIKEFIAIIIPHVDMTNTKRRDIFRVFNIPADSILNIRTRHEMETVELLERVFSDYSPKTQYYVGKYRVDLYLTVANVVIECDEYNHNCYDSTNEKEREQVIKENLGASIIRYNPCETDFHLGDLIRDIYKHIYLKLNTHSNNDNMSVPSQLMIKSPSMKGKYVSGFYNQPVVYLLEFVYNGKKYIKVGWTTDFKERINTHFVELPGCTIYSIMKIDNPMLVEADWKHAFGAFNDKVDVNGSIKTELFTGVPIEEGEQYLIKLCEEQRLRQTQDTEREKRAHELAMKRLEYELQIEMKRIDAENKKHELELKRLELQILQAKGSS